MFSVIRKKLHRPGGTNQLPEDRRERDPKREPFKKAANGLEHLGGENLGMEAFSREKINLREKKGN